MHQDLKTAMNERMKTQWDELAAQNPFYSVASWPDFEQADQVCMERFWESGRKDVEALLQEVELGDTHKLAMLEIGCGLGRMTHCFSERFAEVRALDVSPRMLHLAKSYWGHLKNVNFILGSGRDLEPLADNSVDFVLSYIAFQHIPDPAVVLNYLRETARVLRVNGVALVQFRTSENRLASLLWKLRSCLPNAFAFWPSKAHKRSLHAVWFGKYEAWRGCSVLISDVRASTARANLRIEETKGLGTQYTFFRLRKLANAASDCALKRH
jgi:ubiquinone/menaquinone biosynthesis C-methylase UbiE